MSRQSPWDCAFCGRMSAEEPALKRKSACHTIEAIAPPATPQSPRVLAVRCWWCGARGPLAGSVAEAVERWQYSADRQGAPRW